MAATSEQGTGGTRQAVLSDGGLVLFRVAGVPVLLAPSWWVGSLVVVVLYARLADGDRRVTVLMWAAVAAETLLITTWLHASATQVVTAAACTAGGLALAGAILELRARRPA